MTKKPLTIDKIQQIATETTKNFERFISDKVLAEDGIKDLSSLVEEFKNLENPLLELGMKDEAVKVSCSLFYAVLASFLVCKSAIWENIKPKKQEFVDFHLGKVTEALFSYHDYVASYTLSVEAERILAKQAGEVNEKGEEKC